MKTLTVKFMNEIERYGKRIAIIDCYCQPPERVCTYHYKGLYHTFIKRLGIPIKYKSFSNPSI